MSDINIWAVVAAGASAFVLGGIWYAPPVLGRAWQRAAGLSDEQLKTRRPPLVFGLSLVLSLVAAFVFAMFLGPAPAPKLAVAAGFAAGLCWVAASLGINYLFEAKGLRLFLINGGYHTAQFVLYGLILGLWH